MRNTEDILHSRDKILKLIVLKYESCYRLNGNVNNAETLVKKYLYRDRRFGFSLNGVKHLSDLSKLFIILLCGIETVTNYVIQGFSRQMAFSVSFAIFVALVLELFDRVVDISFKEKHLVCYVEDYLVNTLEERLQNSQMASRKDVIEDEVRRQAKEHLQHNSNEDMDDQKFRDQLTLDNQKIIADVIDEYL